MGEDETRKASPLDFIKLRNESGTEDIHYSVFYEGVPEKYKHLAEDELNETEENRRSGLKKLKAFAKKENMTCTDDDLILVLRVCKYNLKNSEKKLGKFLALREHFTKIAANVEDEKINSILDDMIISFLPYRDKHGRAILFTRPNIHLDLYCADDADVVVFAILFYALTSFPLNSIAGFCYIGECGTDNLYLFYPILNQFRKTYINLFLDSPMRLARVDIVNENYLVRLFYNVVRPIIPEKIRKRLFLNGKSYENLQKVYHPNLLPEELGGNLNPKYWENYKQNLKERILNYLKKVRVEDENSRKSEL